MTLDELTRLTQRTASVAQRLLQIARSSQAMADGLVLESKLTAMELDVEALVTVVQHRLITERTEHLPHRAPRLSTDTPHSVPVQRFTVHSLPA